LSNVPSAVKLPTYELSIISGANSGQNFQFNKERVTLGRSSQNDIVLKTDPKLSRNHAVFKHTGTAVIVSNVSEKNYVVVNGKKIDSHTLESGDKLQIGSNTFVFQFKQFGRAQAVGQNAPPSSNVPSLASTPDNAAVASPGLATPAPSAGSPPVQNTESYSFDSSSQSAPAAGGGGGLSNPKVRFYAIIGIVVLVGLWLFTSESSKQEEEEIKLRTASEIKLDVDRSKQRTDLALEELKEKGESSQAYLRAQGNYVKGRRDYQQGRYERAIFSFEAALSIYPEHVLARRYLQLSKRKFDESIQMTMIQGRKALEKGQFKVCQSKFEIVITKLANIRDQRFEEATQLQRECKLKAGRSY
jgi:pSer/pThr/pTyr-binding forkhead associated (FHA) protein